MVDHTGDNLRRVMAGEGLSVGEVIGRTGLDRRTIQGILEGTNKPQPRTLFRLAEGLGVSSDEFFLSPSQLLYRRFDRQTNPMVDEVLEAQPELFAGWTEADSDELHSRFGTGGCLTAEGTVAVVHQMNRRRELHDKFALLLESSEAEVISGIVELMYERVVGMERE